MPKSEVRQAIANYLDPTVSGIAITSLSKVYQALPKINNEAELFNLQPPGTGVGAVIYLFIHHQEEKPISIAQSFGGQKQRNYTVGLLCIFKSDLEVALDGQVAFDLFVDSLTGRIESGPFANDPNTIFQWGEGDLSPGSSDLAFDFYIPKSMGGGVMLFQATGTVTAIELLTMP